MIDISQLIKTDQGMYRTVVLLFIETVKGRVWFVTEGIGELDREPDHERYYYEEHTCPTNVLECVSIIHNGDMDPHGVLSFARSVWMTKEYDELGVGQMDEWLLKTFPEIGVKV